MGWVGHGHGEHGPERLRRDYRRTMCPEDTDLSPLLKRILSNTNEISLLKLTPSSVNSDAITATLPSKVGYSGGVEDGRFQVPSATLG